jgi:hypothetical protein
MGCTRKTRDKNYGPDSSYDHCVDVRVLGFGGLQCNRVVP